MYLPNFLDGFDRLVAFDAETTGKRTPDAEFIRKQPFAWRAPGHHRSRFRGNAARRGVRAQPETGGQRWPSRRFQASLRETGMPRAVMRLSTLQPTLASTFCAGRVRARSVRPMMVL